MNNKKKIFSIVAILAVVLGFVLINTRDIYSECEFGINLDNKEIEIYRIDKNFNIAEKVKNKFRNNYFSGVIKGNGENNFVAKVTIKDSDTNEIVKIIDITNGIFNVNLGLPRNKYTIFLKMENVDEKHKNNASYKVKIAIGNKSEVEKFNNSIKK